jgi:hypothetical protein
VRPRESRYAGLFQGKARQEVVGEDSSAAQNGPGPAIYYQPAYEHRYAAVANPWRRIYGDAAYNQLGVAYDPFAIPAPAWAHGQQATPGPIQPPPGFEGVQPNDFFSGVVVPTEPRGMQQANFADPTQYAALYNTRRYY